MSGILALALRLALVVAVYGFLAYTLYTLWIDLRKQGLQVATRRVPELRLVIHTGAAKVERRYAKPEVMIGRDPGCDIRLAEKSVSAVHARLAYHHSQWWLEDLGSSNGTHLNSARVWTPTVLTAGDEIRCGESMIRVRLESGDGPG